MGSGLDARSRCNKIKSLRVILKTLLDRRCFLLRPSRYSTEPGIARTHVDECFRLLCRKVESLPGPLEVQ